ncbi:hypothetical protein KHHGKMAE_3540 [Methylobacterium persicinum]|nr:hypothetical protein KHHGKMAE_3540 [Methylobacterium persicinum]
MAPASMRMTLALSRADAPFNWTVPSVTARPPVKVLAPLTVSVPVPALISPPLPEMPPENSVEVLSVPTAKVASLAIVTVPPPARDPNPAVAPTDSVAPDSTVRAPLKVAAPVRFSVPALTSVSPE